MYLDTLTGKIAHRTTCGSCDKALASAGVVAVGAWVYCVYVKGGCADPEGWAGGGGMVGLV